VYLVRNQPSDQKVVLLLLRSRDSQCKDKERRRI